MDKKMATHYSILAWKIYGQRGLVGYSPWSHKESDTSERLRTHTCICILYIHLTHLTLRTNKPDNRKIKSHKQMLNYYVIHLKIM